MRRLRPPGHLAKTSRDLWRALVNDYRIDDAGGLAILTSGCEALDRATEARKQIDADGMTIVDRFGVKKGHPLLAAERDARSGFLQAMRALNLDLEPLRDGPGRPPGR